MGPFNSWSNNVRLFQTLADKVWKKVSSSRLSSARAMNSKFHDWRLRDHLCPSITDVWVKVIVSQNVFALYRGRVTIIKYRWRGILLFDPWPSAFKITRDQSCSKGYTHVSLGDSSCKRRWVIILSFCYKKSSTVHISAWSCVGALMIVYCNDESHKNWIFEYHIYTNVYL